MIFGGHKQQTDHTLNRFKFLSCLPYSKNIFAVFYEVCIHWFLIIILRVPNLNKIQSIYSCYRILHCFYKIFFVRLRLNSLWFVGMKRKPHKLDKRKLQLGLKKMDPRILQKHRYWRDWRTSAYSQWLCICTFEARNQWH